MKDVETLLKNSGGAKPRRGLGADFTNNVTSYLAQNPRVSWRKRLKENIKMKWFTRPAIAVATIAFTVIAGGSAYAAVGGWPGVAALFSSQQDMADGSRIVKVDTKNCKYANVFTYANPSIEQDAWYYRVKPGSKLTNEQIVQMVQGNCFVQEQVEFDKEVISEALSSNPLNANVVGGYIDSVVTGISPTSISIRSVVPYYNRGETQPQLKTIEQTFDNIASDVLVYENTNKISLGNVKVGDHVSVKYRAAGNESALSPDSIDPSKQVVVAVVKNTGDLTAAVDYQKYNGHEFEQVAPCETHPSGYCTLDELLDL